MGGVAGTKTRTLKSGEGTVCGGESRISLLEKRKSTARKRASGLVRALVCLSSPPPSRSSCVCACVCVCVVSLAPFTLPPNDVPPRAPVRRRAAAAAAGRPAAAAASGGGGAAPCTRRKTEIAHALAAGGRARGEAALALARAVAPQQEPEPGAVSVVCLGVFVCVWWGARQAGATTHFFPPLFPQLPPPPTFPVPLPHAARPRVPLRWLRAPPARAGAVSCCVRPPATASPARRPALPCSRRCGSPAARPPGRAAGYSGGRRGCGRRAGAHGGGGRVVAAGDARRVAHPARRLVGGRLPS